MLDDVRYIELKSGYADDGPAWIGRVKLSKSGRTLYFNGLALQKWYADRWADVETGQRYWVSRLKKNGCDRHWAGRGKVAIDRRLVKDYLRYTGEKTLDENRYTVVDLEDDFPVERFHQYFNEPKAL